MTTGPDDVDALLGSLATTDISPAQRERLQSKAQGALVHHAEVARGPLGTFWRVWGKVLEPVLVGVAALGFVLWAVLRVIAH